MRPTGHQSPALNLSSTLKYDLSNGLFEYKSFMKTITSPIQHFSLAGVDLNVQVVFDVLMTEPHLPRAADKIGLSHPATSNALARLRKLFQDNAYLSSTLSIKVQSKVSQPNR